MSVTKSCCSSRVTTDGFRTRFSFVLFHTHTHTQDEVSGNRVRRQRPSESSGDSALPGGSEDGSDVEAYEEYDEDDEEDEDDSHIASSILTPAPPGVSFLLFLSLLFLCDEKMIEISICRRHVRLC